MGYVVLRSQREKLQFIRYSCNLYTGDPDARLLDVSSDFAPHVSNATLDSNYEHSSQTP